jgi:RsiW-degrading membrane proteinase PrsW (M82 family)
MVYMSEECSELGPQYSTRTYLAILTAVMFIVLYMIYLNAYGCDSLSYLLFTALIGSLVGYLISVQNFLIFGKSAVNVMFLPTLGRRSGMDYICVTTNTP